MGDGMRSRLLNRKARRADDEAKAAFRHAVEQELLLGETRRDWLDPPCLQHTWTPWSLLGCGWAAQASPRDVGSSKKLLAIVATSCLGVPEGHEHSHLITTTSTDHLVHTVARAKAVSAFGPCYFGTPLPRLPSAKHVRRFLDHPTTPGLLYPLERSTTQSPMRETTH